jgi:hypothetical protein
LRVPLSALAAASETSALSIGSPARSSMPSPRVNSITENFFSSRAAMPPEAAAPPAPSRPDAISTGI